MDFRKGDTMNTLYIAKTDSVLMFNIGNNSDDIAITFSFPKNPQKSYIFHSHECWLGGLINQPLYSQLHSKAYIFCVILTPYGAHNLIKETTESILNDGFTTETLGLNKHFACLIDKLKNVTTGNEALELAENQLLYFFNNIKIPFSIKDMSPVVDYITQRNGLVKVKQLEEKFKVSSRWLEKQFSVQVGISPKEFARIKRFTAILSYALMVTPSVSVTWASLLEDFGYYDQSHLTKDFQDFTGQSPTQHLMDRAPNGLENIFLKTMG